MINNKKVLAYIPARSGSKGIPDKNIVEVNGLPLMAYTINATKASKYVDRIIVSTDSQQYADIAIKYGADVPFLRPEHLATDLADESDVVEHLINWLEENKEPYDIIIKLQPTSPLRTAEDIDNAIRMLLEKDANCIISVNEATVNPLWMNTLPDNHSMDNFINFDLIRKQRQELKKYYQLNGAVFCAKWEFIKENKNWYGPNTFAYIMPIERSIDIDEPTDIKLLKTIISEKDENRD
ncbi:acylneuraminate cytidylyltransferase family protein [Candidatus Woesearchaeota archaeon]|nr:acylneuraminate cytidylyltransferase family protein [Candidatus Woesearchaeota archaeon]MBW3021492.1 acylneuraminate cytidylyltransferase family protein [Candidatus Woesearchaeota archaeon]